MKDRKVIAFYIGALGRGGAERVMVNLARYFKSCDYEVYLVTKTVEEPEYEVPEGVTRIIADIEGDEISSSRIANLKNRIGKLRNIWKDIKPDVIVSFIRKNNLMALASARGMNIPVIVCIRSNPERELQGRFFEPLSKFMFRSADGIVVQTTQGKNYFTGKLRDKTVIMPNSLSDQFVISEPAKERRKEIVAVGRIDNNKNQEMLCEAFSEISDNFKDWSVHLYGDGDRAGALKAKYESDKIVFHGQVNDVADRIRNSAVFVLTSKQEGMPNALIEAMALGLACISTDCPCGGPADLINHMENGILIPVDDKEKLKEALSKVMTEEALANSLGQEASKISEKLNPQKVNEMWKDYIESKIRQ